MKLDATTFARYQRGGDIYAQLVDQYGQAGADRIAAGAATDGAALAETLEQVRGHGKEREDSTLLILGEQLATDPLGAPLDSANRTLQNTVLSFLRNPWILAGIAVMVFFALGGGRWLGKRLFKT